jgi:biopolymer transport protein ExbD
MRKIIMPFIGIILIGSCTNHNSGKDGHKISIEINAGDEIKIEGKTIPLADLQKALTWRIEQIEAENIQRDSIVTSLRIDKQAQMGTITDVVKTMQAHRLSNIEYTGENPQIQ